MQTVRITAQQTLPLRQAVLRPGLPLSESQFPRDELPEAGHFAVIQGDAIIAVGSIYPEPCDHAQADEAMRSEGAWRLRGMATDPAHRSQGAGERVLKACLEHARTSGAKLMWCNARTGASEFYLRHGFVQCSAVYEMPGIGPHYLMKWAPLPRS